MKILTKLILEFLSAVSRTYYYEFPRERCHSYQSLREVPKSVLCRKKRGFVPSKMGQNGQMWRQNSDKDSAERSTTSKAQICTAMRTRKGLASLRNSPVHLPVAHQIRQHSYTECCHLRVRDTHKCPLPLQRRNGLWLVKPGCVSTSPKTC